MSEYNNFLDEIHGQNVNFLIGSGASAGVIPTLWIDSIGKSFEELFTSSEYSSEQRKCLYYIWFHLWIKKTQILEIEDEHQEVFKKYDEFVLRLINILNNEGFDKPKRTNIFTTNYDTFFEKAFDKHASENRLTFFNDGSRGFIKKYISAENFYMNASHSGITDGFQRNIPTINLVKIHGSVTWQKEGELVAVNLENTMFKELKDKANEIDLKIGSLTETEESEENFKKFMHSDKLEDSILKNGLDESNFQEKIDMLHDMFGKEIDDFYNCYQNFPIVNPTKQKFSDTVFDQHYYQMLRMLSFELEKKNSILIVFGFSFADEHILEIVRRSFVNPYLQVYVIAYSKESKIKIGKKLGNEARIKFLPDFGSLELDGSVLHGNFEFLNSLIPY